MAEETNGTKVWPLVKPVKLLMRDTAGNETEEVIHVLKFRKPVGADLRSLDRAKGNIAMLYAFGAQIADVPERVFDKLEEEDLPEVLGIVSGFLKRFQETFEKL